MFWGEVEGPECGGVSSLFSLRWDRVLFRLKAKIEGTGRALWVSKFGRTGNRSSRSQRFELHGNRQHSVDDVAEYTTVPRAGAV